MPTHRRKRFGLTGRASGRRSRALQNPRSSGRWRSGSPNSKSESGIRTLTHGNSPAGAAARAGWRGLCLRQRARSRRARSWLRIGAGHNPPTSNVEAADGDGAGAEFRPAPGQGRARLRQDRRWRHRGAGIGRTPHPDPPPHGGRGNPETGRRPHGGTVDPQTGPLPRRETAAPSRIRIAGAVVAVGAAVAARDRVVPQDRAARRAPVGAGHRTDGFGIALNSLE